MSSDGFGTLTANIMERGTNRVRAVLGNNAAAAVREDPWRQTHAEQDNVPDLDTSGPHGTPDRGTPDESGRPFAVSARAGTGTSLMIHESDEGNMSEVTVSLWGASPESTSLEEKSENGQTPTSVTYERCDLDEHIAREAENAPPKQMWIDTPTFSGPDRRHHVVSPEIEKRKSVPPRLKVSVRMEQERYLRLKLATQDTKRTQQDIITSAIDYYLDDIGVDRFVRIAMGFGGAPSTLKRVPPDDGTPSSGDT